MAVALSESNKVDGPSLVDPVGLDLSVIVPCFNECNTVEVLLRRARQALPHSQIIVVDDVSTDGSAEKIASLVEELSLCYVRSEANQGKGAAVSFGLVEGGFQ